MLNRVESNLERTYSRVLRGLLRLQQFRESHPNAGSKEGEKRTESQERTPNAHRRAAAICALPDRKFRSRGGPLIIFLILAPPEIGAQ